MGFVSIDGFGYSSDELIDFFSDNYGKGSYHALSLFHHLYSDGNADVAHSEEYRLSESLAKRVEQDFKIHLPEVQELLDDKGTLKFTLILEDSLLSESVLIPMSEWDTLCLSSQVGCGRGCTFCETSAMGLLRNLKTEEIIAQWAAARFQIGRNPRNIVFMGMGEPFDNFEEVIRAIDIFSDQRGAGIPKKRISISTSGHVEGIRRFTELENKFPRRAYRTVHLAVSLNAPNDKIRNMLMPINRIWPMDELKSALLDSPQFSAKDALYFEYVLIPGVNDREEHALELIEWMDGLRAKVNLIPFHPVDTAPWKAADDSSIDRFHQILRAADIECRTRRSRGRSIQAACGMLGKKKASPRIL
ncbi:MAG: 23S rRNA (adenine(2503)-C(2))-methyltransferase RlmN [Spirochaetaceae bacterium]|nr:23S rRNA (adenine(2503)-C(2))-methyltransferase RlmN [Spirochaetaceae bacterium]